MTHSAIRHRAAAGALHQRITFAFQYLVYGIGAAGNQHAACKKDDDLLPDRHVIPQKMNIGSHQVANNTAEHHHAAEIGLQ